jgi:type IV pilus assembly protein PilV
MNARVVVAPPRHQQRGSVLLEVAIAILVSAFGLLGFAGLQVRGTSAEFEALQRSQALLLVEDMVNRINANRAQAGSYVNEGLIGGGEKADCSLTSGAQLDLCEWGNLLRGSSEIANGVRVGAMTGARGCITRSNSSSDRYLVSVAWQGFVATAGPPNPCGLGSALYSVEPLRRTASSTVCVALLRDPAAPAAISRC